MGATARSGGRVPETGSARVERIARALGFPPGPFMVEVFRDPSAGAIVNSRYALPFVTIISQLAVDGGLKEHVFDRLNLVCIKLCSVWRHLDAYANHESSLVRAEQERTLEPPGAPQSLTFSQELFWEFDA